MVSMRAGNNPRCFRLLWYPRPTQAIIINGKKCIHCYEINSPDVLFNELVFWTSYNQFIWYRIINKTLHPTFSIWTIAVHTVILYSINQWISLSHGTGNGWKCFRVCLILAQLACGCWVRKGQFWTERRQKFHSLAWDSGGTSWRSDCQ